MAPGHVLRATLPIRSMSSPMSLTRSTILPSISPISQSIRSASSKSKKSTAKPLSTPQETSRKPQTNHPLRPAMLRDYPYRTKTGTVVSVGRMQHTVTVIHRHEIWDKHIRKYYPKETRYLVSDPRDSLRENDVIEFSSGAPKSRRVHHVVERIITPFGSSVEDRPAVMSREERRAERERRWAEKYVRRESRRLETDVDLVALARSPKFQPRFEGQGLSPVDMSTQELVHRLNLGKERVGKVTALVTRRLREVQRELAGERRAEQEA